MDILNQFGVQPILLAAQVVNFLLLLFILKKLLYQPILNMLKKRQEIIAQSLKNAEDIEKRLNALSEEEQKRIMQAAIEGEKIIKQAQDGSVQIIEEAKAKAEVLAGKLLADAKAELQVEKEKLQQQMRTHLAKMVMMALQKVTEKTITKEDQKQMIEKTIKGMA